MTHRTLLPAALVLLVLGACKSHDLGKPCTVGASDTLPAQPVGGEQPLVEVVTVQRSTSCESFQCLEDRGYRPYCTRECAVDQSTVGAACTLSTDCRRPQHCFQGHCQDDDCPGGFECQQVQDVGPLAGKLFCIYKEHCGGSNRDCEDLSTMDCVRLGCFDSTLNKPTDASAAHTLTCERRDQMTCQCADPTTTNCSGTDLTCFAADGSRWPSGSVETRDVCMRHD